MGYGANHVIKEEFDKRHDDNSNFQNTVSIRSTQFT